MATVSRAVLALEPTTRRAFTAIADCGGAEAPRVLGADSPCVFSACGKYRYVLERGDGGRRVAFVMLNPSSADEERDDPTIRRCVGLARAWGYGRVAVVNLFAWRATKLAALWAAARDGEDIVGPENDAWIARVARESDLVVCAWGNGGDRTGRAAAVIEMLRGIGLRLHALDMTMLGQPRHPLYVRGGAEVFELESGATA